MTTTRSLPPQVREKLGKLMLMLSSVHDGERAAAAGAIERLLKSNGCDWHDLAALIEAPEVQSSARSSPSPPPTWRRTSGPTDIKRETLIEVIDIIEERAGFLPVKSAEFLSSLRARCRFRSRISLSEKQWAWLQDLMELSGV